MVGVIALVGDQPGAGWQGFDQRSGDRYIGGVARCQRQHHRPAITICRRMDFGRPTAQLQIMGERPMA